MRQRERVCAKRPLGAAVPGAGRGRATHVAQIFMRGRTILMTEDRSAASEGPSELFDTEFGTPPSGFLVRLRTDLFQLCTRGSGETHQGTRVRTFGYESRTEECPQNGFRSPDGNSPCRRRTDRWRVCTSGTPRSALGGPRTSVLRKSARLEPGEPRVTAPKRDPGTAARTHASRSTAVPRSAGPGRADGRRPGSAARPGRLRSARARHGALAIGLPWR